MEIEQKQQLSRFRKWLIVQKVTLGRGYSYVNVLMLGVVFAASIKTVLPGLINTFSRFVILSIVSFIGLYLIGWIDKKYKFLHDENAYAIETNPLLMQVVNNSNDLNQEKHG